MITILEAINLSSQYLEQKGIESPRMNAELLLAHIIQCKRLDLYLSYDKPLSDEEVDKYREFIRRRGIFEPLQYITGEVEFFGMEFKVTPEVLIPRPETEILVETVLNNYSKEKELSILDIGCGSGIIGISLAKNLPSALVICTDISEPALKFTKENAIKHCVTNKVKIINHNILNETLYNFPEIDIIVSNPPYVSKTDYTTLQKEIKDYEPRIAVTDEGDGYTFFKAITLKSSDKLKSGGNLFFEIAQGQSNRVKNILEENKFSNIKTIKDYQNIDRVIFGEIR
jgi:release factor glutamine methyltransferase